MYNFYFLDFFVGYLQPKVTTLAHVFDVMFDVKLWLSAHITPLHNHSRPHSFRFYVSVYK